MCLLNCFNLSVHLNLNIIHAEAKIRKLLSSGASHGVYECMGVARWFPGEGGYAHVDPGFKSHENPSEQAASHIAKVPVARGRGKMESEP